MNTNAASDSRNDLRPQLTTDSKGNWIAVWESHDSFEDTLGEDGDILFSRSTDNGLNWTDPAPLNTNAAIDVGDDFSPQLTTDSMGTWIAVWYSYDTLEGTLGEDRDILFSRSTDNGLNWTDPAPLNTNAAIDVGLDWLPQLTTDSAGTWVAVWSSSDTLEGTIGEDTDILFSRSTDNGCTWSDPAPLNTNAAYDSERDFAPQITTDSAGNWIAVWYSNDSLGGTIGNDQDILFSRSQDSGQTWTYPAPLNTNAGIDSGSDSYPEVTTDSAGNWITVWRTTDSLGGTIGGEGDILFSHSRNNGETWTDPAPLNTNAASDLGADYRPQLTTDSEGNWIAVWGSLETLDGTLGEDADILFSRGTILVVNQSPVAVNDSYSTPFETQLVVGAPGVLGNDSDPDGDPLTAVWVTGPTSGTLQLNPDGSFTFTPAAGFDGDVTFTYKATDGNMDSDPATVTIAVAPALVTKFYVVNDASADQTYEYSATGELVESYGLGSGNTAPRGVTTTVAGDKTWVVDANRNVYVYDTSGGLLGSWTAGTLASNATVEGIATNGTDIWIVDARSDKVFKYTNAASRFSGSQNAASSFSLNSGNRSPKDMVTDGSSIWVVNDTLIDKVFKYSMSGSLLGSWTISSGGGRPTGITIDPSDASQDIWIVDSQTDRVYQYTGARTRTSGSQSAAATFALAAGNGNPQGIADPPPPAGMPALQVAVNRVAASALSMLSRSQADRLAGSFTPPVHVDFALDSPATRVDSLSTVAPENGHRFGHGHAFDVHSLMAEGLPVGFADPLPARAVDRLMTLLGRRGTETIQPLEDVVEELINAKDQ